MQPLDEPYASSLPPLLAAALAEDLPDLTSDAIFAPTDRCRAVLVSKSDGVLCGLPAFASVFAFLEPSVEVANTVSDGASVATGDEIAALVGSSRALLGGERTALNFVRKLSGIATLTRRFVAAVAGTGCTILDTRKTTPGWRRLEKYAVRCGGGTNHRMGLYDAAMIKDTHMAAAGSLRAAVTRVRERWGDRVPLVVECASLDDVSEALDLGVRHLLLDNMGSEALRHAVELVGGRAKTEASGGVTLENVRGVAETGVDYVSVGALTHSAPALDLSMKVER